MTGPPEGWLDDGHHHHHRYSLPALWAISPTALIIVLSGFFILGVSALLAAVHWLRVRRAAYAGRPPLVTGWLPWIGAAITFGRAKPALFLRQCQEKYGSVFTLHVAGRYMTFLMDPAMFSTYFNSSEDVIDFQNATQPFLSRGFGVAKQSYFAHHTAALECVRSKLLPKNLAQYYTTEMCNKFAHVFTDEWKDKGTANLHEMIKQAIFWSSADLLFGINKENGLIDRKSPEILNTVGEAEGSNSWLLAILWAAEANTIPAIFWTITYLLANPKELMLVRREMDAKMKGESGVLTYDDFASLKRLNNAISETLRLRSAPIIVRATQQPLSIGDYTVPAGHFLCLSPLWSGRDERLYPEPDAFKPERWDNIDKEGKDRLSFIAFGAGKYRCPGRFFAYHEIAVFVALMLYHYELELLEPIPEPNWMTLVGIQKPASSCQVFYKLRVPVIPQD